MYNHVIQKLYLLFDEQQKYLKVDVLKATVSFRWD